MAEETTTPEQPGVAPETVDSAASNIENLISDDYTVGDSDEPEKKKPESKEEAPPKEEEVNEEDEDYIDPEDEIATDEESDEETDEEDEEEPEQYTVKVSGKEVQVTQDELIKGYQREKDYTQKTQAISEQRKEYDTELASIREERQRYAGNLQQMEANAEAEIKKFDDIDWATLKEEDPLEYREKKDELRDFKEAQTQIQQEKKDLMEKHHKDRVAEMKKIAVEQTEILIGKIPAWKDKEKLKIGMTRLVKYGKTLGYTEREMNSILDHRQLLAIEKARKFDAFQKADPSKHKVKGVPKVTKPGATGGKKKSTGKNLRSKEHMGALEKSGSIPDAARLIANMDFE